MQRKSASPPAIVNHPMIVQDSDPCSKSIEEREAEYEAARARIFQGTEESFVDDQEGFQENTRQSSAFFSLETYLQTSNLDRLYNQCIFNQLGHLVKLFIPLLSQWDLMEHLCQIQDFIHHSTQTRSTHHLIN